MRCYCGDDVAVATAELLWDGVDVGADGSSGSKSANVLLVMVIV
jgi:hypothetical protein